MKALLLLLVTTALASSPLLAQATTEAKPGAAGTPATASSAKNVTPEEVERLMKADPKPLVLDVRTAEEFAAGHVEGATNIDINDADFQKKVAALPASQPVVVHCAAGGRSSRALKIMDEKKFPAVYHLNGGFNAWKAAGKPVAK